eukprot:1158973-Pelagomonas_calceolata.AAC.4
MRIWVERSDDLGRHASHNLQNAEVHQTSIAAMAHELKTLEKEGTAPLAGEKDAKAQKHGVQVRKMQEQNKRRKKKQKPKRQLRAVVIAEQKETISRPITRGTRLTAKSWRKLSLVLKYAHTHTYTYTHLPSTAAPPGGSHAALPAVGWLLQLHRCQAAAAAAQCGVRCRHGKGGPGAP